MRSIQVMTARRNCLRLAQRWPSGTFFWSTAKSAVGRHRNSSSCSSILFCLPAQRTRRWSCSAGHRRRCRRGAAASRAGRVRTLDALGSGISLVLPALPGQPACRRHSWPDCRDQKRLTPLQPRSAPRSGMPGRAVHTTKRAHDLDRTRSSARQAVQPDFPEPSLIQGGIALLKRWPKARATLDPGCLPPQRA